MFEDFEACYRAVQSREDRFDGWFFVAVTSTGIYCRPSCPARTPKREHLRFHPTAASAQLAGFRACKRCRPDVTPGSPEWDSRADLVARAMRLIADGVVDRDGVAGLAARLGYSERQLNRRLIAAVGAPPVALARAQRAHTARVLIETTDLRFADVAFGAGFASVRQFNDVVRDVFATTPSRMRALARRRRDIAAPSTTSGRISLRLPVRQPFDTEVLLAYLEADVAAGVESVQDGTYRRTLTLPHGAAEVALTPLHDHVRCDLELADLRDLTTVVHRCRRLLDLDADPIAVDAQLGADPVLTAAVRARPGLRVPGSVDPAETALRTVLGQQVSLKAAQAQVSSLVSLCGPAVTAGTGAGSNAGGSGGEPLTRVFPTPDIVAAADLSKLRIPDSRRRTLRALAEALASGDLVLDDGVDPHDAELRMLALPGIGPWTAQYVRLRGLGDGDVLPLTDLAIRRGMAALGAHADSGERWRPWRSYAAEHIWSVVYAPTGIDPDDREEAA